MSVLFSCNNLSKSYSSNNLFEDLSFSVHEKERLGIIGNNGTGKSTLLKILAELEETDSGDITYRKGLKLAYVTQDSSFQPHETISNKLRTVAQESGINDHEIDAIVNITLGKLGDIDGEQRIEKLSGGWKKRVSIACGLVQDPDILLLDEPTNHLDIEGVLWLEDILKRSPFSWIVISHDRYFLNKTVNRIAEIGFQYPDGVFVNEGNYDQFVIAREELLESQERYRDSLANKVRREEEWLRRGPKARSTKAKHRIDSAMQLQDELKLVNAKTRSQKADIDFSGSGRKSKKLMTVENLSKTLGEKLIVDDLSINITGGMRLGILGKNGSGKSTILNLLASELPLDQGQITHVDSLKVLYFDQEREGLNPDWTLKRALSETGDNVIYKGRPIHVFSWAKRFLFTHEQMDKKVSDLSGGEKAKIHIARLMLRESDVLLLDEPTNDLDISTIEILEESFRNFDGALILVSHDRYTMESVCNQFLALDRKNKWTIFSSYEQWEKELKKASSSEKSSNKSSTAPTSEKTKLKPKKLSYKDQREYDQMEDKIMELETLLETHQKHAEDPEIMSNSVKLQDVYGKLENTQKSLESLYTRWSELEKMMNGE